LLYGFSQFIKNIALWIKSVDKDIALWIQSVVKGQCSMESAEKGYCSMDAPWSQSDDKEQQCSMDSVN
jgi:hypothetical protein